MKNHILIHLIVVAVGISVVLSDNLDNVDVQRDAKLSTPELIKVYGYPSETHEIITEDGYILEVHRIANPGRQPVLLFHGMLDSSATWVMIGPNRALGYILYDLGYDVWLTNARGNIYSNKHTKYNRNGTQRERKRYWNFSWHEIGIYDLPATIDYIVKNTSHSRVHYVGHSQGTTAFFVLMSERPEYNDKIFLMAAMAPIYMAHLENELLQLNVRYLSSIETVSEWIGFYEFSNETNNLLMQTQSSLFCTFEFERNTQLCNHNFSPLIGNITDHVNRSLIPIFETHAPAGASMKQLFHFGQLIRSHRFCQFDYGMQRNLRIYNRTTPPDYNLKNCKARVAIIYSDRDTLSPAEDVKRLPLELPNVMDIHRVDDDTFNHIDFIWSDDAKELVYDYITEWIQLEEKPRGNQVKI